MISIKNLTKTYKNKKGREVKALDNISLTFPDKGLIFIVGKSGSGKSTLLNLLGGLDSFDTGDIVIDNQSLKDFSNKQLDDYHNYELGFVFQEFNLLEDYSIRKNLEIVYDLQNQKYSIEQIQEALHEVDLDNYEDNMVNELSGGEKQRVAISRAILKNPKIILCDEPTGNLDDENSEIVFNILKQLSTKSLVIVVSHDSEAANKYAQRIVRLNKGQIVLDSNAEEIQECKEQNTKTYETKSLPFKTKFVLASSYFKKRKIRLGIAMFFAILCFVFVAISLSIGFINEDKLLTNSLIKGDISALSYGKKLRYVDKDGDIVNKPIDLNDNDIEYLKEQLNSDVDIVYDFFSGNLSHLRYEQLDIREYYSCETNGCMEIDQKLIDKYDFTLVAGRLPENDNEIVLPKHIFETYQRFSYVTKYGVSYEEPDEKASINSYDDLIGRELEFYENDLPISKSSFHFQIVGILDTKFNEKRYESLKNGFNQDLELELSHANRMCFHNIIYLNKGFYQRTFADCCVNYCLSHAECLECYQDGTKTSVSSKTFLNQNKYNYQMLTKNNKTTLNSNEVLLPLGRYTIFYKSELDKMISDSLNQYIHENFETLKSKYPDDSVFNSEFSLYNYIYYDTRRTMENKYDSEHAYQDFYNAALLELFKLHDPFEMLPNSLEISINRVSLKYDVVGYFIKDDYALDYVIVNDETFKDFVSKRGYYTTKFYKYAMVAIPNSYKEAYSMVKLVNKTTEQDVSNYLAFLRDDTVETLKQQFYFDNEYEYAVSNVMAFLDILAIICQVLFAIGLILLITFMSYYFVGVIFDKQKEIGILRALGMNKKDTILTFIFELLIVLIPVIIVSFPISLIALIVFNNYLMKTNNIIISIISFSPWPFILVAIIIFIILFIGLVIPLIKLIKKKPYELINRSV